ncbi:hypothetical protein B0O80DRAFT_456817 [Mortierella sp. GBAus27b]|nr:hypothetical protein B0O80DRAFT_456817 [Mortierella sp. GBAus27b]
MLEMKCYRGGVGMGVVVVTAILAGCPCGTHSYSAENHLDNHVPRALRRRGRGLFYWKRSLGWTLDLDLTRPAVFLCSCAN